MSVKPYRPKDYGKLKPFDVSILVLGESSYTKPENRGKPLPPNHNDGIIGSVFKHETDNTITKAVGVFYGEWRSWEQRCDFWRKAAFANFVQADMGGPSTTFDSGRPTDIEWEWECGVGPFLNYLSDLQPDFVLALGSDLWRHLPSPCQKREIWVDGEAKPCYIYPNGNGWSLVFGIDHPAMRRGWSYKWTKWVTAAIEEAKKLCEGETEGSMVIPRPAGANLTAKLGESKTTLKDLHGGQAAVVSCDPSIDPDKPPPTHEKLWQIVRKLDTDYEPYGKIERYGSDCSCGCRHFVKLAGEVGNDWGVCSNPESPRSGFLTFEHQGCSAFEATTDGGC
jgi:hypothetical protein